MPRRRQSAIECVAIPMPDRRTCPPPGHASAKSQAGGEYHGKRLAPGRHQVESCRDDLLTTLKTVELWPCPEQQANLTFDGVHDGESRKRDLAARTKFARRAASARTAVRPVSLIA